MKKYTLLFAVITISILFISCDKFFLRKIQYKVSATNNSVVSSVTYLNENGEYSTFRDIDSSDWSYEFTRDVSQFRLGDSILMDIAATGRSIDSTSGTITVQIMIDNDVVATNKGGGRTSSAATSYIYYMEH